MAEKLEWPLMEELQAVVVRGEQIGPLSSEIAGIRQREEILPQSAVSNHEELGELMQVIVEAALASMKLSQERSMNDAERVVNIPERTFC